MLARIRPRRCGLTFPYARFMAERIVSLVPSLTELVCWFGLSSALVGRTRFCTEPPELVAGVPIVGGTKNPKVERIVP